MTRQYVQIRPPPPKKKQKNFTILDILPCSLLFLPLLTSFFYWQFHQEIVVSQAKDIHVCACNESMHTQNLHTREIHPLEPQHHRYCMRASTAYAPRVTRCSLGLYWSRDQCTAGWLAGWELLCYLGQIVRGSEIWWFMTSVHSLSTSLSCTQTRVYSSSDRWDL